MLRLTSQTLFLGMLTNVCSNKCINGLIAEDIKCVICPKTVGLRLFEL